jgi:hypothetical protein
MVTESHRETVSRIGDMCVCTCVCVCVCKHAPITENFLKQHPCHPAGQVFPSFQMQSWV